MPLMTENERYRYLCVKSGSDDWWYDVILELFREDKLTFDESLKFIERNGNGS